SFDRLARTVRRTVALARKLSEPAREAPGPKLRPAQCPHERRADRAETAALYAEPCERAEGADCDADEDLDDDLDEDFSDLDELIARLYDSPLAHLTDAELRQLRTTPSETCDLCAHREAIPRREHPRSGCKAAGLTSAPPTIPAPPPRPRPGTGPPAP
ncbi:MAG: hypothetical protein JO157_17690, partial [Acetobacteraceae bacterium]|nr:hypothetical protein [Acetobacteraceae bacterium]